MRIKLVWDGRRDALWIPVGYILGSPDLSNWWAVPAALIAMLRITKGETI